MWRIDANVLKRLANENRAGFRLGHCSLINVFFKVSSVSTKPTNLPQRKVNNIDKGWFKKIQEPLVRIPRHVPQEIIPFPHQAQEEEAPTAHPQFDMLSLGIANSLIELGIS